MFFSTFDFLTLICPGFFTHLGPKGGRVQASDILGLGVPVTLKLCAVILRHIGNIFLASKPFIH